MSVISRRTPLPFTARVTRASLYGAQVFLSFFLMLVFMTYNVSTQMLRGRDVVVLTGTLVRHTSSSPPSLAQPLATLSSRPTWISTPSYPVAETTRAWHATEDIWFGRSVGMYDIKLSECIGFTWVTVSGFSWTRVLMRIDHSLRTLTTACKNAMRIARRSNNTSTAMGTILER